MRKQLVLILSMVMIGATGVAQDRYPFFSQFSQNYFFFNPAVAGMGGEDEIHLMFRNTVSAINDPNGNLAFLPERNFGATYEHPLDSARSGVGIQFYNQSFIQENVLSAALSYSYSFALSESVAFRIGGSLGLGRRTVDLAYWQTGQPPQFLGRDPANFPVVHFGALFYGEKFKIGIAGLNVNRPQLEFTAIPAQTMFPSYNLYAEYREEVNPDLIFKPWGGIFTTASSRQANISVGADLQYLQKILVGAGYRNNTLSDQSFIMAMVGVKFSEAARLSLSYDYQLGQLTVQRNFLEGSLGIFL